MRSHGWPVNWPPINCLGIVGKRSTKYNIFRGRTGWDWRKEEQPSRGLATAGDSIRDPKAKLVVWLCPEYPFFLTRLGVFSQ